MIARPSEVISVLIVEDNRTHRMCAAQSLANYMQAKVQRHNAVTIAEAREHFKTLNPDLVLLDINLPDGNGIDLLPELLTMRPKCFIVMMTGSTSEEDFKRAKELGARGYILKPFNMQVMHRTITASRYFCAHIDSTNQVNRDNAKALFITMPDIDAHLTKPEPEDTIAAEKSAAESNTAAENPVAESNTAAEHPVAASNAAAEHPAPAQSAAM